MLTGCSNNSSLVFIQMDRPKITRFHSLDSKPNRLTVDMEKCLRGNQSRERTAHHNDVQEFD